MGYGCYGGNEVFEENWEKSRECLVKLADMFLGGKGCIQSKSAGANLITSIGYPKSGVIEVC